MRIYDIITKKKHGEELTDAEIEYVIREYTKGTIPDYQISALMMAIYFKGMTDRETATMTLAMANSGDTVDLSEFGTLTVDKHSTGGVGDKTTLVIAPIAASLGAKLAKMSGRGLGHTGGTVDKLESFPGYDTSLSPDAFFEQVRRIGISVIGQSGDFAPADKKLYALRDVTATVDSIPLITASIMSKKLAAGSSAVVLDVKYGSGGFMKTPEDAEALSAWLTEKAGNRIYVKTPFKGDVRKLCDMAGENARIRSEEYAKSAEKSEKSLVRLASLCGLETVPMRIEAFDISNFGDDNITAGMVVYEDAKPKKSDYRLFTIRSTQSRDDYTSMREAVSRRIAHLSDEGAAIPDLILIDGGEVHRAIAAEEVRAAGYAIPVFGMVKDEYHKTRALVGEEGEISIAAEQSVYTLIYRIQEEVHRFTISKMSAAKRKTQTTSVLEEIPGIGRARAKALLTHFGGLSGVKKATVSELCSIRGVTTEIAEKIVSYFNEK